MKIVKQTTIKIQWCLAWGDRTIFSQRTAGIHLIDSEIHSVAAGTKPVFILAAVWRAGETGASHPTCVDVAAEEDALMMMLSAVWLRSVIGGGGWGWG